MTDDTVCIKYSWQHPNHDPFKIEEISLSRLPDELKQWLEQAGNRSYFPSSLLIDYQYFLENLEEWCIDSTHKTSKSFNTVAGKGSEDCFLFTIVMQNPITNKGLSVCFFITDHEYTSTLNQWLTWVKNTFTLKVKRIMIDCSPIEIGAIEEVFGNSINILLCYWHIKRAWEVNLKKHIKVQNSTHVSNIAHNSVHAVLSNMMHATTSVAYDILYNKFLVKFGEYENFILIMMQSMEIESYHNQLKTFYFGRLISLRVDRLIYLLAKVLTLDYRQESDSDTAMEMVEKLSDTAFTCRSFTIDLIIYNIELQNDFLQNCTCPDTSKLCKHIFLINCMLDIPYSLRQNLSSSSSAVHVSNTDTKAVVDTSLLSDEIEADIMKYC
ncbi:hypothetical protein PHYBLDRAFT_64576 [Phycomyces blakesleeanus NRRL 1555(-)]|uniref:SWIM-type domain-containing protein n=1 Tax=Phycomyces blakesleeanus (strain ATCC 8743b / DSM 1359 / FGSC 10004 / NBRC 33097 / NRRL 1555) TaxID=763407 RepID=A0A167NCM1_PHYB8|nr:hypothetical protein PHYBLDRAFT_64576 [Phycomyces blakesleeanus NRRL 1555(-)]OAD75670.1 hypothetical protein PHYBLDRAFT_64576 [Phycomyces blakesleeanus NRRL 1555(-)]|eukprot:XP_018293710.1 hypothetical protein PHYBLDRAFT_64576 [Phycomyces blakesleeanus NRRL 1555(-)]